MATIASICEHKYRGYVAGTTVAVVLSALKKLRPRKQTVSAILAR